jgi:Phage integrase family
LWRGRFRATASQETKIDSEKRPRPPVLGQSEGAGQDGQLRQYFATEVYASSKDIRVTQELLGHSDPSTTAGYVAYSLVDAAAAVRSLTL